MNKNSLLLITLLLVSCGSDIESDTDIVSSNTELKEETFIVWSWVKNIKKIEWQIISNNTVTEVSSINWNIELLNCENWEEINIWDLIAKITPDKNNQWVKNSITQLSSLNYQLSNTQSIKTTTINNFDTQLSSLISQKDSLYEQLDYLKNNLDSINAQKDLTSTDLTEQINLLNTTLENIKEQKIVLENSKNEDLNKVTSSIKNIKEQIYNSIYSDLLYVDELYWITDENDDKNDLFENYLAAKNSNIKSDIETSFNKLNSISYKNLNNEDLYDYIIDLNELITLSYNWVNNSVESSTLTSTLISTYYSNLLWYSNSLVSLQTSFDSLLKSITSIENSYKSQILNMTNSISSTESNLDNLKNNKWESTLIWIDINISNAKSQISNLENSIITIENNILSLNDDKKIQINNLDNQILTLEQSISSLNINLTPLYIYSKVNWIISNKLVNTWNNIWVNSPICEIIPSNLNNYKLKIYSSEKLTDDINITVFKDNIELFTFTKMNLLPSIDTVTQNYIYERILNWEYGNLGNWDKVDVFIENMLSDNISDLNDNIEIPLNYITPKLSWKYVKIKSSSWAIVNTEVITWRVNLPNIEIIWGLEKWQILIK